MAAGAYVLTNPHSGNVADMVKKLGQGAVLEDDEELDAIFRDGRMESLVERSRTERARYQALLSYSSMTFSVSGMENST